MLHGPNAFLTVKNRTQPDLTMNPVGSLDATISVWAPEQRQNAFCAAALILFYFISGPALCKLSILPSRRLLG